AAASALGKFGDRDSVPALVAIYVDQAGDADPISEPRSKVVLLAIAKILGIEEQFARNWRREQHMPGYCLPGLLSQLAKALAPRTAGADRTRLQQAAVNLGDGPVATGFAALQGLRPLIAASAHPDAPLLLALLDGTA